MNKSLLKKIIIISFLLAPISASVISTFHIINFFNLGNVNWMSILLSLTVELGAVASFLTLSILSKLNKIIVWSVFIILFLMQIIGNMYASYEFISIKMQSDALWLNSFSQMMSFFVGKIGEIETKMYLTILISWPIPVISLFLLKSLMDYMGSDKEVEIQSSSNSINSSSKNNTTNFYDLNSEERERIRSKLREKNTVE